MIPTFKKLKSKNKVVFALIIGIAVILFWRGVWQLADLLIFPNNALFSNISSLIIGLIILLSARHIIKELT